MFFFSSSFRPASKAQWGRPRSHPKALPQTGLHTAHGPGSTPAGPSSPSPAPLRSPGSTAPLPSPGRASNGCGLGGFQECFPVSILENRRQHP